MGYLGNQITTVFPTSISVDSATISGSASVGTSLTVANGFTLSDGNVTLANGHGINFAATSDVSGMTGELLDDYEEGSFTPIIGGASGAGTLSYNTQAGTYTKIGRTVHFNIVISAASGVTGGGGTLQLDGLPFTARDTASGQTHNWYAGTSIGYFFNLSSYGTATQDIKILGPAVNGTHLRFHSFTNQGDASAPPTQANVQGSTAFYVGGTYEID